jgi:hypothetical protein
VFTVAVTLTGPGGATYSGEALIGSRSAYAVFPAGVLDRLGVPEIDRRLFESDDGTRQELRVGQVQLRLLDYNASGYAIVVFGPEDTQPRLGHVTLAAFCLEIDDEAQRLFEVPAKLFSPRLVED